MALIWLDLYRIFLLGPRSRKKVGPVSSFGPSITVTFLAGAGADPVLVCPPYRVFAFVSFFRLCPLPTMYQSDMH